MRHLAGDRRHSEQRIWNAWKRGTIFFLWMLAVLFVTVGASMTTASIWSTQHNVDDKPRSNDAGERKPPSHPVAPEGETTHIPGT